ncbi:MAG: hypothetical protein RL660_59 [Bacteroidota bacterium]|jgi:hypothetical protein
MLETTTVRQTKFFFFSLVFLIGLQVDNANACLHCRKGGKLYGWLEQIAMWNDISRAGYSTKTTTTYGSASSNPSVLTFSYKCRAGDTCVVSSSDSMFVLTYYYDVSDRLRYIKVFDSTLYPGGYWEYDINTTADSGTCVISYWGYTDDNFYARINDTLQFIPQLFSKNLGQVAFERFGTVPQFYRGFEYISPQHEQSNYFCNRYFKEQFGDSSTGRIKKSTSSKGDEVRYYDGQSTTAGLTRNANTEPSLVYKHQRLAISIYYDENGAMWQEFYRYNKKGLIKSFRRTVNSNSMSWSTYSYSAQYITPCTKQKH